MAIDPSGGLLLIDKDCGLTSHQVVAGVRRALGVRRVGHAGTLDPLASGLLPILVGPATRLVRFLHDWEKTYTGVIRLGAETPTGDAESAPEVIDPVPTPEPQLLARATRRLSGPQLQRPPAYSAKKVGGVPAHRLARRGAPPRLAPSAVTIHRLRLFPAAEGRVLFAARVSSGTYIRSLARDLGQILGTGAYLETLVREGIGPLRRRAARPLDAIGSGGAAERLLVPVESIPLPFDDVVLPSELLDSFCHGRLVSVAPGDEPGPDGESWIRVLGDGGRLAGIGRLAPTGDIQPKVVLAPSSRPAVDRRPPHGSR